MVDAKTLQSVVQQQIASFQKHSEHMLRMIVRSGDPVAIAEAKQTMLDLTVLFQASLEWVHTAGAPDIVTPNWNEYLAEVESQIVQAVLKVLDEDNS